MRHGIPNGFLIAIEGVDGAGKSTLAKYLVEALAAAHRPVTSTKEHTQGEWGKIFESRSPDASVNQELKWLTRDREEHWRMVLYPALRLGHVVITDRYFHSTAAYQGQRADGGWEVVLECQKDQFPEPDLLVLLMVDPILALQRIRDRDLESDVYHDPKVIEQAAIIYKLIAEQTPQGMDVLVLKGDTPVELNAQSIMRCVPGLPPTP